MPTYKRALLKLSGEALGEKGVNPELLMALAADLAQALSDVELACVLGAGNLCRGRAWQEAGMDPLTGDDMGMVATLVNALALRDALSRHGVRASIMSPLAVGGLCEPINRLLACQRLSQGEIVLFAGGTGHPLVTTDTAASLRAVEIGADVLLKGTQVDGVFDADPSKDSQARLLSRVTFDEVIANELAVMDAEAFLQCRRHRLPLVVFNIHKRGALGRVLQGEAEGTQVGVFDD